MEVSGRCWPALPPRQELEPSWSEQGSPSQGAHPLTPTQEKCTRKGWSTGPRAVRLWAARRSGPSSPEALSWERASGQGRPCSGAQMEEALPAEGRVPRSMARMELPAAELGSRWIEGVRLQPGRQIPRTPASEQAGGRVPTEALALPWGARMSVSLPPESCSKNKTA